MSDSPQQTLVRHRPQQDAPEVIGESYRQMRDWSTGRLRDELSGVLSLTAQHVLKLAAIVRLLEERGEDLSDLKYGLLGYVRRIAYGQVLPELVVAYQGHPGILSRLCNLPLPDQRRIASGDPLPVVESAGPDGTPTVRLLAPERMGPGQLRQVIDRDHVRGAEEQVVYLRSHGRPGRPKGATVATVPVAGTSLRDTIAEECRGRGLSDTQLARISGVGYQTILGYFRGRSIRSDSLDRIVNVLGLKLVRRGK